MLGGNPTAANPSLTRLLHAGEMFDPAAGLYNLRAGGTMRIGRFTSVDPVFGQLDRPETLHRYIFGANDPVNRVDPSGEFSIIMAMGVVALLLCLPAIRPTSSAGLVWCRREPGGIQGEGQIRRVSGVAVRGLASGSAGGQGNRAPDALF